MAKERTLADFGYEQCEHPLRLGPHPLDLHCPFCGAKYENGTFTGGMLTYKIDLLILRVCKPMLRANVVSS